MLFAGDLVEAEAALYTGDAFHREWASSTLDAVAAIGAEALIGGRGAVSRGRAAVDAAIAQTRHFLDVMIREVGAVQARGGTLKDAFDACHAALRRAVRALADLRALPAVRRVAAVGRAVRDRAAGDLDGRAGPGGLGAAPEHEHDMTSWPHDPVLVVGAGPVGQTTALLLARWGVPSVVLDRRPARDLVGSKAICQQRDVLDIWASVGAGEQIAAEGVTWTTARTFHRDRELFAHTFADAGSSPFPPFVNLSQSRTEEILDERIAAEPLIDLRWGREVTDLAEHPAPFTVLCTGAAGGLRRTLGVTFDGFSFDDRFLICDIRTDLPGWATERRFFFDPAWNPGRQVLVHPCPGSTFRIDWQVPAGLRPRRRGRVRRPRPAHPARSSGTGRTRSCGSRCTGSTRGSPTGCGWGGCCSRATRRTSCRRSGRGGSTPGWPTRRTPRGRSRTSATAGRPRSCWRATTPNGTPRRGRTSR